MKKLFKKIIGLGLPLIYCLTVTFLLGCEDNSMLSMAGKLQTTSHVFYVSPNGNDSNVGSIGAPLKTVNFALSLAQAGDSVVVRAGTYIEKIQFPRSGAEGNYITLIAYPGEQPLISGTGLPVVGHEALVTLQSVNWIWIEGLEIAYLSTSEGGRMVDGILVTGSSSNVMVLKNHVHHIHNNASPSVGREGHGIHLKGNASEPIRNVFVHDNEIHDNRTGTSENLTVNGYVKDFDIRSNKIYNGENIAICIAGGYGANGQPAFDYAHSGSVVDNQIWNIDGSTGQVPVLLEAPGTIGIYIDGARYITVENNRVWNSDRGIGLVSENDGFPTEHCTVRGNVVYNNRAEGIYLGGYANYTSGGTKNCLVLNNTLYHNAGELGYNNEEVGEIRLNTNCHYNEIHNNILVARPERGTFIRKNDVTGSFNGIDYNLYYTTGSVSRWFWNGTAYLSLVDWKNNSGGDTNGQQVNPLLVAPTATVPDFRLTAGSPAINQGTDVHGAAAGSVDAGGQARYNGVIDIGAYEYY